MKKTLLKSDLDQAKHVKPGDRLFLAVAFAAVFTLIILVFLKMSDTGQEVIVDAPVQDSSIQKSEESIKQAVDDVGDATMSEQIQAKLPVPRSEMVMPSRDKLPGKYFVAFARQALILLNIMENGDYELIFMESPAAKIRKYSRGNFSYEEGSGVLTLYPSKEAGAPKQFPNIEYKILTMRAYDIQVSQVEGETNLFFIAPEQDIANKSYHPIFPYVDFGGAPVIEFQAAQIYEGD